MVTSYCGCSHCDVHFDVGPGGPIYALARRYLPAGHVLRSQLCTFKGHQFEFRNNETRRPPSMQTTQSIFKLTALQRARNVSHFLGQKGPTMFSTLLKFDYCSFNFVEWMHNLARAFDNLMDFLVGRDAKFDARCRRGVQTLGIFRDVCQPVMLSRARTNALARVTDALISRGNSTWCRRWLRMCGKQPPADELVRDLRRRAV